MNKKLRKLIGKVHLWLGLVVGVIVFIVAITGCIYAFQEEIGDLTQPYRFVDAGNEAVLPPTEIRRIADEQLPGKHIHGVLYEGNDRATKAIYYSYEDHYYDFVYVNQFSGEVLKVKDVYKDFFRIILDGHFYLWLPPQIGQPVVATATLLFVVMLISGIYLWWPRGKKDVKKRFKIKWNARWRRKNYDLHNVLGFYTCWLALILAVTGLVWGFQWFRDSIYFAAGGEKSLVYSEPASDTTAIASLAEANPVDYLWYKTKMRYPNAESIEMHFPENESSPIHVAVNPDASTYWKMDYIYFDQYTLEEVEVGHIWDRFEKASIADKLMRMNYDIHVGAIFGLPGKIIAFFTSLLVASLPVTGFIIWWGRRNKQKNPRNKSSERKNIESLKKTGLEMPVKSGFKKEVPV